MTRAAPFFAGDAKGQEPRFWTVGGSKPRPSSCAQNALARHDVVRPRARLHGLAKPPSR